MWRLTLAQMRRSLGRLTAAGLAIVIGTAFVAATLIAGAVITRTSYNAVAASYADADLVVTAPTLDRGLTDADLATLRGMPAVVAVDGRSTFSIELVAGASHVFPEVSVVASDPRLEAQKLVSGAFPTRPGQLALPGPIAARLGVGIGDTLTANAQVWKPAPAGTGSTKGTASGDPAQAPGSWVTVAEQVTVVGLLDDPAGAFAQSGGAVIATAGDAARWVPRQDRDDSGASGSHDRAVVALAEGTNVATATTALKAVAPKGTTIRSKDDEAAATVDGLTNGSDVLTMIVLGFAAVAMLVAALVISNTFQVLIAQRTRTLALLRCVGADKRQLRRSVLLEAGLLGATASALGLLIGVGLAQGTLSVLGRMNLDVPLPAVVSITPAVVLVPLVVGILVTVLAALAPARAATRVAPLAALRPADAPAFTQRRNLPRLVLSALMTTGGVALLVLAVIVGQSGGQSGAEVALFVGLLGGALSFTGVLVGAVFWIPRVVGAAGRLLAPAGTAAKLATANTVRNPRRTAATSAALLIGVTLVTMMSTGAASARSTLDSALDSQYPVDVIIESMSQGITPDGKTSLISPVLVGTVAALPGVAEVVSLRTMTVQVAAPHAETVTIEAKVIDRAEAKAVVRAPSMVAGIDDKSVILSAAMVKDLGLGVADGDVLTVTPTSVGADGVEVPTGKPVKLTAVVTDLPSGLLLTPAAFARMGGDAATNQAWARLTDVTEAGAVVPAIEDALSETAVQISGAGVERAQYQRIIDTLLAIVVGLLAVAVVIALIGVANTLSLSVIERGRESATLRAIGLSRRQLRTMLAFEGVLIAGVGAVIGATLGTLYGWAGAATILGAIGDVRLAVPWRDIGLVVLVALVAGLLASVLPGRAAARTSPVAALAVD